DYVASLEPYLRWIPTRLGSTFRLDLLGRKAAQAAIQGPAGTRGVKFTPAAVQKLVDDLRQVRIQNPDGTMRDALGPYLEPVQLQVVCRMLWEKLPAGINTVHVKDLQIIESVNQALADFYSKEVRDIASQTGVRERILRDWFGSKLITEQGIRGQVPL